MAKIFTLCFLLISFSIQAQSNKLLPGKIEAEDFAAINAVGTENTSDADGGLNVGWIQDGSWMDYNVLLRRRATTHSGFALPMATHPTHHYPLNLPTVRCLAKPFCRKRAECRAGKR
jgi:hypothetical protein